MIADEDTDTPTSSTFTFPSPTMGEALGGSPSPSLKVDPRTDLAAYTYEGYHGRYAAFFWQSAWDDYNKMFALKNSSAGYSGIVTPGSIYHSTFLKTDPGWTLVSRPICVAVGAKPQSPLAAVTWSNGLKGAMYYLNERNNICEQVTTDGGKTWKDGLLTKWAVPTRANSNLAAVVTWESLRGMGIYVYFQDQASRLRELRFVLEKGEWLEDSPVGIELLKGLSGTSIACGGHSAFGVQRWIYTQSTSREVQELRYVAAGNKWSLENPQKGSYFTQNFDRKVRLGFCCDPWQLRVYAHDGSKVLEKVQQRVAGKWEGQGILPMGTGTAKVKENFVVLLWPQDVDNTGSEVHLYSTEGGILHDYLVGAATGGEFSLV